MRSVASTDRAAVEIAVDDAFRGRPGSVEVGVVQASLGLARSESRSGSGQRRCELTFRAITSDDGGGGGGSGSVDGVIVCAADVTDRSRLRSELEHRASHDALTGCLNRAATVAALERALRESQ